MTALPLNDAVAPLGLLFSTWTGEGRGTYASLVSFLRAGLCRSMDEGAR